MPRYDGVRVKSFQPSVYSNVSSSSLYGMQASGSQYDDGLQPQAAAATRMGVPSLASAGAQRQMTYRPDQHGFDEYDEEDFRPNGSTPYDTRGEYRY